MKNRLRAPPDYLRQNQKELSEHRLNSLRLSGLRPTSVNLIARLIRTFVNLVDHCSIVQTYHFNSSSNISQSCYWKQIRSTATSQQHLIVTLQDYCFLAYEKEVHSTKTENERRLLQFTFRIQKSLQHVLNGRHQEFRSNYYKPLLDLIILSSYNYLIILNGFQTLW